MTINQELKQKADEIYNIGIRNGGILMKNKILMALNRDWNMFKNKSELALMIRILKKINKLKP